MGRQLDPNRDPAPRIVRVILMHRGDGRTMTAAHHRAVRDQRT